MNDLENSEVLEDTVGFHEDESESEADAGEKTGIRARLKKRKKLLIFGGIIGVIILVVIIGIIAKVIKGDDNAGPQYKDVAAERRTISNTITGSSSVEPNDSYNVTTMKSGDIDADYFKEGDTVKKGDKLYQFDDEDAQMSLTTAKNSVTKSQLTLSDAQTTYNKQYVKSDISGKVREVYVSAGDSVQNGTKIAEVYNDSTMKLVLPFNEADAAAVHVGDSAEISVVGISGGISGTVTGKSSASSATGYHTTVVYVTIEVKNPGTLTEEDSGSALINGVACADSANFQCISSHSINAEVSGTVDKVNVVTGDRVSNGTQLAYVNSTQAQNSLKNAQLSLDDAKIQLQRAEDTVKNYLIEAPIDGTVVTKNAKAGDTIDTSNSQTPLCVIYDLSCVKFSIDVDETEVALVKVGQKVNVTADAVEGDFEGEVIKVPVDGVNQNGVTTYTIEVQIDNYGDLLPGMNIDAEITVEEAENVIAVPVNSVNRGNIVFVKDDGTKRQNDVTDKINGAKKSDDRKNDESADNGKKSADKKNADAENYADSDKSARQGAPSGEKPQGDMPSGERPQGNMPSGERPQGDMPSGSMEPMPTGAPSGEISMDNIPMNIEIPEGYRAIKVETGINDTEYIEIKSGLSEGDLVRTLDTQASSAGASFGNGEATQGMPNMGGMGGMSGGMPGGGGMSGGGNRGGGGMPGGGMR